MKLKLYRTILIFIGFFLVASNQEKCISSYSPEALGTSLEGLLEVSFQLNPDLAALSLEAESMHAKAEAAGALGDPMLKLEMMDITRRESSLMPGSPSTLKYSITQSFPLWGKRDLIKKMANLDAKRAKELHLSFKQDLQTRVKAVFAEYYQVAHSLKILKDVQAYSEQILKIAQISYSQGTGGQQEIVRIEVELTRIQTDYVHLEQALKRIQARLNMLLNRTLLAPLALPSFLPPLPQWDKIALVKLIEKAHTHNPLITSHEIEIASNKAGQDLVEKSWYPDITVGIGAVDNKRRFSGYEAMISVNIPIEWSARQSQEREAALNTLTSKKRLESLKTRLQGEIEEAIASLVASIKTEKILKERLIPQVKLSLDSSLAEYEVEQKNFLQLLEALVNFKKTHLDLLNIQAEKYKQVAEIERLIGESL